jgi:predicted amidohydrolase
MIKPYVAACVQPKVFVTENRGDIKRNLERHLELIDYTAGMFWEFPCKLITFPEYFMHGVTTTGKGEKKRKNFMDVAVEIPGEETEILGRKAKEYGLYIAGGGIVERMRDWPDRWFNTGVVIGPEGDVILKYHKWHVPAWIGLGTSPHDVFDEYKRRYGEDLKTLFPVVETPIGKLGIFICYDGRTPEVARALTFNGAEVLVHSTASFDALGGISGPLDSWTFTNRARGYENMIYIVAPNWGEVDYKYYPRTFTPGKSLIVDYNGTIISQADYPGEAVIGALIDIESLRNRRSQIYFNLWADLRAEPFKKIYENPIYPPNRFIERPPESLSDKMEGEMESFKLLYERGIFTKPSIEPPTVREKIEAAQRAGTLKKR